MRDDILPKARRTLVPLKRKETIFAEKAALFYFATTKRAHRCGLPSLAMCTPARFGVAAGSHHGRFHFAMEPGYLADEALARA